LGEELAGTPHGSPFLAPDRSEATLGGATRFLHCTFSTSGSNPDSALRFDYAFEDAERHKMVETGAADGAILFAVNTVARRLDPAARPFSTAQQDAVSAWGRGDFERAVALDPDFGTAWTSWVEQLARSGKPDEALAMAERAVARASLRTPLSKARLQLQTAVLRKDDAARLAALNTLAGLAPNDSAMILALAEANQKQRRFSASANDYRRVLAIEPSNASAMNGLGYAEGEAGNLAEARKILEEYGRQPGQGTNALDSLGEVHFMKGRFADAEKYFSQVAAREPGFLDSAPLLKAAYARWLGGDLKGADAIVQRYLDAREAQKDAIVGWRKAAWLYATGRKEQAMAQLDSTPADQKAIMDRQRSVWRGEVHTNEDLAQLKALYQSANPAADGLPRVLYASALARAGKSDEARALLKLWPLPETVGDPLLQSLVYPQFLDLRRQLGIQ
jgi:Tfp pilus assembly protein PilF